MYVEVLWVVDVLIRSGLNAIDDSGFEVEEDSSGDVARIVGLVEEDILAITAFGREIC